MLLNSYSAIADVTRCGLLTERSQSLQVLAELLHVLWRAPQVRDVKNDLDRNRSDDQQIRNVLR